MLCDDISKRIGLFFGSFNPIHIGHLVIAEAMLEHANLKEVWFVVSPQNPFKQRQTLLADRQRLEMVRRAIFDDFRFRASDVEFSLPQPSYTVVTLQTLAERYPDKRFALIMGSDNLASFPRWRNSDYILQHYPLLVYPRPGVEACELEKHPNVSIVDVPMMDISSTYIRHEIACHRSPRYLLHPAVYDYIAEMHFYAKPYEK